MSAPLAVVATSDGGRTWRPRSTPCGSPLDHGAFVALVTPQRGWILCNGQGGTGQMAKAVYLTIDGGWTWRVVAQTTWQPGRRSHGGISGYGYPEGIAFARDGFGVLWEGRGTLYVTRDGGRSWRPRVDIARPEIDFGKSAAVLLGGRAFTLVLTGAGSAARLLRTDDAGRTWRVVRRWP